jgi:hypothetical protein
VRVSRADDDASIFVWVGAGVNLIRAKVAPTRGAIAGIGLAGWTTLGRAQGLHDDSGHLGVDAAKRPALYGSDGGIFRPTDASWSSWTNAATGRSGWNSLQITDLAGTNTTPLPGIVVNALYFTTQDNAIWASPDGGLTWPTNDCTEGFHMEVRKDAPANSDVQVAYGKMGCNPTFTFSDSHLLNPRAAPDLDGLKNPVSGFSNTFLIAPGSYARTRKTPAGTFEIWVSASAGATWRRRYVLASGIAPAGVFQFTESTQRGFLPVTGAAKDANGAPCIGLMPIFRPFLARETTLGEASIRYLPQKGSLGVRATEFDFQAVFGLHRTDWQRLIAPDVNNGVVLVSRDGSTAWTPDAALTALATRNGALLLYDGDAYHPQVTHVSFSPYDTNIVLVGTREAGVLMSDNGGGRWFRLWGSDSLLYGTGFAFRRDDMAIASAYGRGLWAINLRYRPQIAFTPGECAGCTVVEVGSIRRVAGGVQGADTFLVRGGSVRGARVRGGRLLGVTLSPGSHWVRYLDLDRTATEIAVDGDADPKGLRRLVPDLPDGQHVVGFQLRDATVVAALLSPAPLPPPATERPPEDDGQDDRDSEGEARPYVAAMTDLEVSGRAIVGHDGTVRIVGGGFRRGGTVRVLLDGRPLEEAPAAADANGGVVSRLDTARLEYGEHVVEVVQGDTRVRTIFVKAHQDRFEPSQSPLPRRQ